MTQAAYRPSVMALNHSSEPWLATSTWSFWSMPVHRFAQFWAPGFWRSTETASGAVVRHGHVCWAHMAAVAGSWLPGSANVM